MNPANPQICSAIKLRGDKFSIYWRERKADGKTRQVTFYWGEVRTEKLKTLLVLIASPRRNERKRICRMVGLKMPDLSKDKMQNSDFLKTQIFGRLKEKERQRKKSVRPPRNIFAELEGNAKEAIMLLREWKSKVPLESLNKTEIQVFIKEWKPIYDEIQAIKLHQKMSDFQPEKDFAQTFAVIKRQLSLR